MAKIVPRDCLIIEPFDRLKKHSLGDNPFAHVVASNNLGTVKYSLVSGLEPGRQVYFGSQYEKLIIEGVEVLAMKVENIIAVVND